MCGMTVCVCVCLYASMIFMHTLMRVDRMHCHPGQPFVILFTGAAFRKLTAVRERGKRDGSQCVRCASLYMRVYECVSAHGFRFYKIGNVALAPLFPLQQ